ITLLIRAGECLVVFRKACQQKVHFFGFPHCPTYLRPQGQSIWVLRNADQAADCFHHSFATGWGVSPGKWYPRQPRWSIQRLETLARLKDRVLSIARTVGKPSQIGKQFRNPTVDDVATVFRSELANVLPVAQVHIASAGADELITDRVQMVKPPVNFENPQ